jgi:hypothetical protein
MNMAERPLHVFESKLGPAKGVQRSRIWIEGKRLVDAGFTVGQYFVKEWKGRPDSPDKLVLVLLADDDVINTAPCKVSGKGDKPIIDITGALVYDVFGDYFEKVEVAYYPGRIEIRGLA